MWHDPFGDLERQLKRMEDCLRIFDEQTAKWFRETLGEPTPVQEASWPAIASGQHVLVCAPTGTGKTLAAFLVFLDNLKEQAVKGGLKQELYLIYVSPLKSLAADIRENLRSVIAFVEGRRYAEKLEYYVNLLGGEDFARVHHGSLSKEQRQEVEQSLRAGRQTRNLYTKHGKETAFCLVPLRGR